MLRSLLLVGLRDRDVVGLAHVVRVFLRVFSVVEAVVRPVHIVLLVLVLSLEALVGDFLRLSLELLAGAVVLSHDLVLVGVYPGTVRASPLEVDLALVLLLLFQVIFVPIHEGLVLIASLLHLVGELRVLLRDSDLLLKSLLLVVQLSQTVLEHLGLAISKVWWSLQM